MQFHDGYDHLLQSIVKTRLVDTFPADADIGALVDDRLRAQLHVARPVGREPRLASLRRTVLIVAATLAVGSAGIGVAGAASPAVRHVLRHVAEAVGLAEPAYSPVPFHVLWPFSVPRFAPASPLPGLDDVASGFILPTGHGIPGSITSRTTTGGPPCPSPASPCGATGNSLNGSQFPPELQANADRGIPAMWFRFQAVPPGSGYVQIDEQAAQSTLLPSGQTVDLQATSGSLDQSGEVTTLTFNREGTEVVVSTNLGRGEAEMEARTLIANDEAQS